MRRSSLLLPALVNQPAFTLPPAAVWVEVPPLQYSFPLLTLYSRHCPIPTMTWVFRFPFAISLSLSIFFLPSCCLICSMDSDPRKLSKQPRRMTWLCTSRSCCCCWTLPGNCVWIMYWKCPWQTSCSGVPYTLWKMVNLLGEIKNP